MSREQMTWAIITGEYPPQPGGVSGYSWIVAHALAAAGDAVHVFAPAADSADLPSSVIVHRLPDVFGARGRRELYAALDALPRPRRALLQFVLQAFGMRAVNAPFIWSLRRLRGYPLWIYFHEFALDDNPRESLPRRIQAYLTRRLARIAARHADHAFVSTPAWTPLVRAAAPRLEVTWLPIPSNIVTEYNPAEAERIAARIRGAAGGPIVGHFGTYRMKDSRAFLQHALPAIARADDRRVLLLGRGSTEFASAFTDPALAGRIIATGDLEPEALANHLAACDVLVQPYADGATTRRGSLFAGLALGVPCITTLGPLTEDLWAEAGAVYFVPPNDVAAMLATVDAALRDPAGRRSVGERGRELYRTHFDVAHTVRALRDRT